MERILYGYVKITLLGNLLVNGWFAQWIAAIAESHVRFKIYLSVVRNGLDVYFQFSGYSDIAIGFALLLGYRVIENFNWPYLQPNISRFWQSWHISLSRWCRDYVYAVVLSSSRSPALAALSTMLVIGLWHAISLNYFFWGLYHAFGIIAWQRFQKLKGGSRLSTQCATAAAVPRPKRADDRAFCVA